MGDDETGDGEVQEGGVDRLLIVKAGATGPREGSGSGAGDKAPALAHPRHIDLFIEPRDVLGERAPQQTTS